MNHRMRVDMHLIEILLPVYDNAGERFPREAFDRVRQELTGRFGGVTAFMRAPAVGLWRDDDGVVRRDDIVIFEVMTTSVDAGWWNAYRHELSVRFAQQDVVIRALEARRL